MDPIIVVIASLAFIVIVLIYYRATKVYSLKYIEKVRQIARIILLLNIASLIMSLFTGDFANLYLMFALILFVIICIIVLFLIYALFKAYLRTGQSLSDKNWLMGSSYLKGKFKWSNIDWKLIFIVNTVLVLWTIIIIRLGNPQIHPNYLKGVAQGINWAVIINLVMNLLILAPIQEEIVFRFLGMNLLLHWFGKKKATIILAILVPTVIWTFLHSGFFVNNWVKYIQVFPCGIVFGYLAYKKDLEHSILTHMIFNGLAFISANIFLTDILK